MQDSRLKHELQRCSEKRLRPSNFSIGHRGSALQFPEHTRESYVAAARMGAGILECDVTFTSDGELVCRHAECDLHTTTNILQTPLANKCSVQPDYSSQTPFAGVRCCSSDITLSEFKSLCGKMDAANSSATDLNGYLNGTANWRTDLYSTCGTLMSHQEAVHLFDSLDVGQSPELKSGDSERINTVFGSQDAYAQALINELKRARIKPHRTWAQSFNIDDIRYWVAKEPAYGRQAVFLDGRDVAELAKAPPSLRAFRKLRREGINIIAPPMPVLLTVDTNTGQLIPSKYAQRARRAGLDIISWTIERSGRVVEEVLQGNNTFYYQSTLGAIENDGDLMTTIDVLAQNVGIIGLFSDWPGTVTYYANCKGL
ncbi:MAG: glycerophosphodiester phosphodiesterase [Myxococcales bacterium]|nr:glycerophosphodiester phosphodiesterase [Myxococcales bacterium]